MGVSEVITDGVDGFILEDPRDSSGLAELIGLLYHNDSLRQRVGEAAARTARQYTWEWNAEQLGQLFKEVIARKTKLETGNSKLEVRNSRGRDSSLRSE
jgi:glycosyltransferase involved in cell wall biosynthesis